MLFYELKLLKRRRQEINASSLERSLSFLTLEYLAYLESMLRCYVTLEEEGAREEELWERMWELVD
jgi:hypothetical protein